MSAVAQPAPAVLGWGGTHTWPNGDTVTVAKPHPLDTSTASPNYRRVVAVDVTVRNAGPEARQVHSYVIYASADGQQVDGLAAPDLPFKGGFIAPGASKKWTDAWQLPTEQPVELELQVFGEAFDPARPVVFFRGTA